MFIQTRNFGVKKAFVSLFEDENCNRIPRTHQYSEIQCVMSGSFYITVDGETKLAKKGDVAVITPFRVHGVRAAEPNSRLWICAMANDFVSDFISGESSLSAGEFLFTPPASLFEYVCENVYDGNEKVLNVENNEALYRKIKAIVYPIFESFTSSVPQTSSRVKTNALAKVLLYLNEHFKNENISRESVAKALCYTPTYISHCISVLPDMSFAKLLNSLRVEYAKKLLLTTDYSVTGIAIESGFSTDRSFYRAFMTLEGISPGEYRSKNVSR